VGKDWEPGDPPPEENDGVEFAAKIIDVAKRAAAQLPDIAKIPLEQREAFCERAAVIIADTQMDIISRDALFFFQEDGEGDAAVFEEIERAAVALNRAVGKLTTAQFNLLQGKLDDQGRAYSRHAEMRGMPLPTLVTVPLLAIACSKFVGKNALRSGQEGNVVDWEFQRLVHSLWTCAREHGGDLNASKNGGKFFGAMFKAIDVVRRHIVHIHVPPIFRPSQRATVVEIVADAKKGIPPGITGQYLSILEKDR
jgi:hypothetical protein